MLQNKNPEDKMGMINNNTKIRKHQILKKRWSVMHQFQGGAGGNL